METLGDDSAFAEYPLFNSVIKETGNMKFLDNHDGFSSKPEKLMKNYKDNTGDTKVHGKVFIHMTNFDDTEYVAN